MTFIFNKKIALMTIALSINMYSFNQATHWFFYILPIILIFYTQGSSKISLRKFQRNIIIMFVLFLTWILLTAFISGSYYEPTRKSLEIALTIAFLMTIFSSIKSSNDYHGFLISIVYSGLILSLYIISTGITASSTINFEKLLVSKNPSGLHLTVTATAIVYLLKTNPEKFRMNFVYYLIITFALFLTLSVKSIASWVLITSFLALIKPRVIFILIVPIVYLLYSGNIISEIQNSPNYFFVSNKIDAALGIETNTFADDSVYFRQQIQEKTLELFYQNPFFGIGLENTRNFIGTYSHNHWIELLAGGGVLAATLYALPIIYVTYLIYVSRRKHIFFYLTMVVLGMILIFSQAQKLYDSYSFMILFSMLTLPLMNTNKIATTHSPSKN